MADDQADNNQAGEDVPVIESRPCVTRSTQTDEGKPTVSATATTAAIPVDSIDVNAVQRRTTRVLMLAQVIGTIGVGIAPSIGVLLAGEVTNSEALAGSARTASTLGAALLGLPLGNLATKRGRRVALTTGWWIAAIGAAVLVAAAQWSLIVPLFIGLLLIGAGSAVSLQSRFAATDLADPHTKARALALVVWVGTFGAVLGPNLGTPGERLGNATGLTTFAAAFLIAAIGMAIAGLVVFTWLRPDPLILLRSTTGAVPTSTATNRGRVRMALAEIRTNPRARVATLAIVTAQIVMVAVMTMTPVHVHHHGGSVSLVGITISLHIAGMYLLAPVVGVIADRYGHRVTIGAGITILFISLTIAASSPARTNSIVVALILLGVGWSFVNVAGSALFSSAVSDDTRASSQGGVDALSNLFGATAALISGPLMAVTSFSFLALAAMVSLVPLTVTVAVRSPEFAAMPEPPGGVRG